MTEFGMDVISSFIMAFGAFCLSAIVWTCFFRALKRWQKIRHKDLFLRRLLQNISPRDAYIETIKRKGYCASDERAWLTLGEYLNNRQLSSLVMDNFFVVVGSHSKKAYVIHSKYPPYNITGQNSRGGGTCWCVVPTGEQHLPLADILLMQMLIIKIDEPYFLKIAH